ncbi:hypothetical protein [Telluribacter sp. SYSU D00476]|uniref:hypothetical protein n=1 Tax=Telluribacter sp. SYSU D00476 TaxID=2811430 RepID=UPI001FF147D4|nr:hypothetical protein [Telluribacter sp. SYSU D00476]
MDTMQHDLEYSLRFFEGQYTITFNDVPLVNMTLFQECMEYLSGNGYVSVERDHNGLISAAYLTNLGQQKFQELVK